MDRSAVAKRVRWGVGLVLFTLATCYLYALAVGGSPESLMWIPALSFLLAGLFSLVFTPDLAASADDRIRRHPSAHLLELGMEPTEQSIRWLAIGEMVTGAILLALWAFG